MRKNIVAGNWKMNKTLEEGNSLASEIVNIVANEVQDDTIVVLNPPYIHLNSVKHLLKDAKQVFLGAQNCNESLTYGASTGSINPTMLKNVGAKYVILGHSENRDSGETDKLINAKIRTATRAGLKVIFCIGETLGQKQKKITKKILSKQIIIGLQKIKKRKNIVIAYEPVWSIGTGLIPKADDLFNTINFIKKKVRNIKVLYGGSVNPKNINKLKLIKNIDGFLIGGASQDPKKFIDIIKKTYN